VQPLLLPDTDEATQRARAARADTAIFYSISNCHDGLRGVSFGNLLIKQVVEELRAELPQLKRFSTQSPVPGFRRWLKQHLTDAGESVALSPDDIENDNWVHDPAQSERLRPTLMRLCARYLTQQPSPVSRIDPVARFHLSNGARLERINWLGDIAPRAIDDSFGIMVNYRYDHDSCRQP
jgi:malonyl-CoA decarboxylase